MIPLTEKEIAEIKSLVTLLDDEDESVYAVVREKLLTYPSGAVQYLPQLEENSSVAAVRFKEVRELILRSSVKAHLRTLKRNSEDDIELESAAFAIARYRYPEIDPQVYTEQLNNLAAELKEKLSSLTDEEEIFRRTIAFFVEEKRFNGNKEDYYSEENHYLNRVLDTGIGIPITVSLVYLLVGNRINLPIRGIGLPGHFILRFTFGQSHIFFDPYNGGKVLSAAECQQIVKNLGYQFLDEYLQPVSNVQIIERVLRNIILLLEKKQDELRVETIRQFIDTLNFDS